MKRPPSSDRLSWDLSTIIPKRLGREGRILHPRKLTLMASIGGAAGRSGCSPWVDFVTGSSALVKIT